MTVDLRPGRAVALVGTFDPPTEHHAAMLSRASAHLGAVQLAVLTEGHADKDGMAPLADRVRMAKLAFPQALVGVVPGRLYLDAAEALAASLPDTDLWLAMGSDAYGRMLDPRFYGDATAVLGRLSSLVGLALFARDGDGPDWHAAHRYGWTDDRIALLGSIGPGSSTDARNGGGIGRVPMRAREYAARRGLYGWSR